MSPWWCQCCRHGPAVVFIKQKCIYAWMFESVSLFLLCTYARNTKGARSQPSAGLLWTSPNAIAFLFNMLNNSAAHRWRLWGVPAVWNGFSKFYLILVFMSLCLFFFVIYCTIMHSFCLLKRMQAAFCFCGGINFEVLAWPLQTLQQRRTGEPERPPSAFELWLSTLWCQFSKQHKTTA